MATNKSLCSTSFLLILVTIFYSPTVSAQVPPASPTAPALPQPPTAAPPATAPAPAPAPGMSTVPLVPATPNSAPIPIIPKAPTIDIVRILQRAKRFSVLIRLLKTTQLINQLNSQLMTSGSGGLTIFAPDDSAFSKLKPGFLNSLNDRQKVELLQFHTLSSFIAISNFDTLTNPVQTQAGDNPTRLQLNVTTYGGNTVSMTTGVVNATVSGTIYTDNKLAIYQVDKVLLPKDVVLPKAPAPAPKVAAAKADSPKSDKKKSSLDEGSDDNDNEVPIDASAGSLRFKAEVIMWAPIILGVLGAAI